MSDHPIVKAQKVALIGVQAAEKARSNLLQALRSLGIDEIALACAGNELLYAVKQKVHFDKKTGEFHYSKPLADNVTRFNAFKLLLEFQDVMPSKKVDVNDQRSVRQLAGMLFEKMEKAGQLGADDKHVPVIGDAEADLMSDMVEMRQAESGEFERQTEDEDEDEGSQDDGENG